MLSEKPLPTASVKRRSLDATDVENDAELDALTAQVLAAGNTIAESERAEMIRKGIIDEHGNLMKRPNSPKICARMQTETSGADLARPRMVIVAGVSRQNKIQQGWSARACL